MGIDYKNLDHKTRKYMLEEMEMDVGKGTLYISNRLTFAGKSVWPELFKETIISQNDDWLATQLNMRGYMNSQEERKMRNGRVKVVQVSINAAETLSEGEFNRFYARGLCVRAIAEGINEVIVVRGKQVYQPRLESQAKIGKKINPTTLLEDLRKSQGIEPALGIPPGPNSGLTICLP